MKKRVVVTGIGTISPLGKKEELWANLLNGKSGVDTITSFDVTDCPVKIGAEVRDFEPSDYMDKKEARRMDRFCQFAVAAAKECIEDGNLIINESMAPRVGVIVGSGIGGIRTIQEQAKTLFEKGYGRVSPFFVPMLIPDMASGRIAIEIGAKGPNSCTVTACASGTHSIGDAFRLVTQGYADIILAGGAEAAICELGMSGFVAARTLSTRNDAPKKASRPFDKDRDGFVMGEGACIIMLESLDSALSRRAKIYGEVVGFGSTADAFHITSPAPEGEGAQRAIKEALKDAGISSEEIDYINAHGTSTDYNDRAETVAIKKVFGEDKAKRLAISSTKSLTGHMLGAAGALEAAISVLSLKSQEVPGTYNYETPDPDCDLDYIPNTSRQMAINYVMSNSFGFGGHNGVLIFKRWDGQ